MRRYRNRQGLTKGKKTPKGKKGQKKNSKPKHDPNHRTRPELALELIIMVAQWFPNDEIIVSGDSAYGGRSILSDLPPNVHLISHVHPNGALYEPAPPKKEKRKGPARKKGDRLPGMKLMGRRSGPTCGRELGSLTSSGCIPPWRSRRSKPCTTRRERTDF